MIQSVSSKIRDLVAAKLCGRKADVVGFVEELLQQAQKTGPIRCSLSTDEKLRLELAGGESLDIDLDACRGKLRSLCAHLYSQIDSVKAANLTPYGGEGIIQGKPKTPANGTARTTQQWAIRFKNTPDLQEFAITPVKDLPVPTAT